MALAMMNLGHMMAGSMERASLLLDQVLKIEPKNEKALMRKCNVLLDLGQKDKCLAMMKTLEEVAFQSERSQTIYQEITNLKERMEKNMSRQQHIQAKAKEEFDRKKVQENDWYYQHKKEQESEKKLEEDFASQLNPLFRVIYQ